MTTLNLNHPNLQKIAPEKLNLIKNISNELNGMPTEAAIAYILALNSKLKEANITFTTEEYNLFLSAITHS